MKVSIQTLGCKVNFAEMAELGDRLARAGFTVSDGDEQADICVINSCTVTAQADRKLRTMVHGLRRRHPQAQLILTGCHVDNPNPRVSAVPSVDVAFTNNRKGEIFDYLTSTFSPAAGTRGVSQSQDETALIERAQQAVADGYGEIVLTGVDLGAFGRDRGNAFAPFVGRLLAAIAPARLRLSSINANDFTPELVELAASPRFCRHLHIPLQSGSDRVLKRMGRLYRRRDYLDLIAALRTHSPDIALTTDVIVGFPGETDADFADTQAVAADAGLTGMHVFRYSPRAGTAAPRLGMPVDDPVSRDRSHRLQAQADTQRQAYEARFIGRDLEAIWDRRFPSRMRGLTDNYITVYAPERGQTLGAIARVRPLTRSADGLLCG